VRGQCVETVPEELAKGFKFLFQFVREYFGVVEFFGQGVPFASRVFEFTQ
jgi:hypothetical protein